MSEDENIQWQLDKKIPIALIAAFLLQAGGTIWSISGLYSKVDKLSEQMVEVRTERYTKEDARRDSALYAALMDTARERDEQLARRILVLESRIEKTQTK